ncbi:MAG: hypothetical protein WDN30_09820 [Pararobbsia sp.]
MASKNAGVSVCIVAWQKAQRRSDILMAQVPLSGM